MQIEKNSSNFIAITLKLVKKFNHAFLHIFPSGSMFESCGNKIVRVKSVCIPNLSIYFHFV